MPSKNSKTTKKKVKRASKSKTRSKSKSKSPVKDAKFALKKTQTQTSIFFNNSKLNDNDFLESVKLVVEESGNYDVFPKPDSTGNTDYRSVCMLINSKITHSEALCKGLNPTYIKGEMPRTEAIIAIGSKGMDILPNGNLFAFAMLVLDERRNSMYLDIICSNNGIKGAGHILMTEINRIAKSMFITKITLNSVFDAVEFYEKYGFVRQEVCKEGDLCEMTKRISVSKSKSKSK